jgi:hypothetical protein
MIKIYKISSDHSDQVYVGSTKTSLEKRLETHTGNINKCSSKQLIDLGNYKISLIEEVHEQDRYIIEQYWIDQLDCVNQKRAFITEEEKEEQRKQYYNYHKEEILKNNKKYREDHKEEILKNNKKYYEEHKEEILKNNKKYYEDHKEEILKNNKKYREDHKEYFKHYREEHKEQIKQYYQNNKEELKQRREECKKKFTCECGKVLYENSRNYHMKSKLHEKRMKNLV